MTELPRQKSSALSLPEQLLLLAVDGRHHRVKGPASLYVAMAGGLMQELVTAGATVEGGTLRLNDSAAANPLPVDLHDRAASAVRDAPPKSVRDWVGSFAAPTYRLGQQVTASLEKRGALRIDRARRFGLFPVRRVMLSDGVREPIVAAARTALTHRAPIAPRMQALLVLADAAGLTDRLVDAPQRAAAERRIRELADDVIGAEPVQEIVKQVQAEVMAAVTAATTTATINS